MFKKSFRDEQTLFLAMGHEILHAAYYSANKNNKNRQELTCRFWAKETARGTNYYDKLNQRYIEHRQSYRFTRKYDLPALPFINNDIK